jgi:hypothetical protein
MMAEVESHLSMERTADKISPTLPQIVVRVNSPSGAPANWAKRPVRWIKINDMKIVFGMTSEFGLSGGPVRV